MLRRSSRCRVWTSLLAVVAAGLVTPSAAGALTSHALRTAVADTAPYVGPEMDLAFAHTRAAGATAVRLFIGWRDIAPQAPRKPAGFNPANPGDPHYNWAILDAEVRSAVRNGLDPILSIFDAPTWAQHGSASSFGREAPFVDGGVRPDPREYGLFASAVAKRYGGHYAGLPRVRYWQAWNEPSLFSFLVPQYNTPFSSPVTTASRPVSPQIYAPLVNAFAASVHRVHRDNLVIAGGLPPFGRFGAFDHGVPPLFFMRQLLCLTNRDRPQPGCHRRLHFDVWGQDPYTGGGPQHRASVPGNVSIGNLPQVSRTLAAAVRAGRIVSNGPVRFWVLEFAWNTNPPFSQGVPINLHGRWVAEALYRMWLDGVSLVTWFQLRDDAFYQTGGHFQSGLFFRCTDGLSCDQPKPAFTAFRFPFVAYRSGGRILVWGRTPASRRGTAIVQQQSGSNWVTLRNLRTDRFGIFTARLPARGGGDLRAVFGSSISLPFSLIRPPDRIVNPAL